MAKRLKPTKTGRDESDARRACACGSADRGEPESVLPFRHCALERGLLRDLSTNALELGLPNTLEACLLLRPPPLFLDQALAFPCRGKRLFLKAEAHP